MCNTHKTKLLIPQLVLIFIIMIIVIHNYQVRTLDCPQILSQLHFNLQVCVKFSFLNISLICHLCSIPYTTGQAKINK